MVSRVEASKELEMMPMKPHIDLIQGCFVYGSFNGTRDFSDTDSFAK